jgi:hypothetical protein
VSTAAFDACALMTPEAVSAIVGGPAPVAKPVPAGGWVAGQCAWSSPTAAFLISVGTPASIASVGDPTVHDAKGKLKEFERRVSATGGSTPVTGVGDGAFATDGSVAAAKGDVYLEVVGLRLTNEQSIEVMKLAVAGV